MAEGVNESEFLIVEQVFVALFYPQQHLAEIVQVVERVVDGMSDHKYRVRRLEQLLVIHTDQRAWQVPWVTPSR